MTSRLVVSYLAITLLVLILLEVPLGIFYSQREQERLIADVERDAVVLASLYEVDLSPGALVESANADLYAKDTGARVVVTGISGISVVDTAAKPGREFLGEPEVKAALDGGRASGIRYSQEMQADLVYVTLPILVGGHIEGMIRVNVDSITVNQRVKRMWSALAGIAAVALLGVTGLGIAIARSVTRPLRDLQASARRFAEGELAPIDIDEEAPPEVKDLTKAMNTMAARLDGTLKAQRSFVGDASHQLRTPLTAMRLRLENLHDSMDYRLVEEASRLRQGAQALSVDHTAALGENTQPHAASLATPAAVGASNAALLGGLLLNKGDLEQTEAARDDAAAALAETERLGEIVECLLVLARAGADPDVAVVDARELVVDRVDTWTAIADESNIGLYINSPDTKTNVIAVPGAIEQILDNTIDNAILASEGGTAITVSLFRHQDRVCLSIADQGPGLSDEQKQQARERFWRADTTRSGTGLGLAVVDQLAIASGAELFFQDSASGGLDVQVHFRASTQ